MAERLINIGKIVNTHGIKGELRVVPLTDFPERFFKMKQVLVNNGGKLQTYRIQNVREYKNLLIIKFAEIDDMNAALLLKNAFLQVTGAELTKLPEHTYYIFQLEGLEVFTVDGGSLGKLHEVITTGANDVWAVRDEAGREILVPAIKQVIKSVDLDAGKVIVDLPEGL
ncbi:MAG: ribosome maturation factor RimM [Clostridia bacterium]|nr:ribosome maturation factor RimM [Clostridia bacterium]